MYVCAEQKLNKIPSPQKKHFQFWGRRKRKRTMPRLIGKIKNLKKKKIKNKDTAQK